MPTIPTKTWKKSWKIVSLINLKGALEYEADFFACSNGFIEIGY